MFLLLDKQNVIVWISEMCDPVSNGYLVEKNLIFGIPNVNRVQVEEIPVGVEVLKYKFVDNKFIVNENYVEPEPTMEEYKVAYKILVGESK